MNLTNETAINVAGLLQDIVGAARLYQLEINELKLDDDLVAKHIEGEIVLTRLSNEILADVSLAATVELECQRCLESFEERVRTRFSEPFLMSTDVHTGIDMMLDAENEETLQVSQNHEIDLLEPLRQEMIVAMPMRPLCRNDCAGIETKLDTDGESVDPRFSALADLLTD